MTIRSKLVFYTARLPLILVLTMAGFIFEFLIELPFRAMMFFHQRLRGPANRKNKKVHL
jgi:hypothetical protein